MLTDLVLLEDTRQKPTKHKAKHEFFEKNGIEVERCKLYVGDYTLANDQSICIDTKFSMGEIYTCLIQDHDRFRDEADRAVKAGIELVVLIEEPGMHSLEDVKHWENPRLHRYNKIKYMHSIGKWKTVPEPKGKPPTDNITLMKIMYTMQVKHGVRWEFCNPKDAGRRVIEILTEGKEVT